MDTANLENLLDCYVDGTLSADEKRALERMLLASAEVRELFWSHVQLHCSIRSCYEARSGQQFVDFANRTSIESLEPPPAPISISLGPPGGAWHGTASYFSSGWPVAYLAATVIFGIGLLIGSHIYVSHPVHIARQSVPLPSPLSPLPQMVGRITGMVDCKWEKGSGVRGQGSERVVSGQWPVASGQKQSESRFSSHQPLVTSHLVFLGDKFSLSSGLMEITYDTGAKVILQGPVTYEVESKDSGFLSLGKLTASVEKRVASGQWLVAGKSEIRNQKSEISNPQSLIPNPSPLSTNHYPLFTIKTPTAVVTDLGTEFGVEVDKQGDTTSHVFRGSAKLQVAAIGGKTYASSTILHENESARVAMLAVGREPPMVSLRRMGADSEKFVRQMPNERPAGKNALPVQVVAWYRLGEDDPGAVAGAPVNGNTVNHNGYYHLSPRTNLVYSDNVPPTGSSLSVSFSGADNNCLVNMHVPYAMNEDFVLEAWVCVRKLKPHPQFIVYNGDPSNDGYGLIVKDGRWQYLLGRIMMVDTGVSCELGKWTHVALVSQRQGTQLWVNGQAVGTTCRLQPNTPSTSFAIGCDHTTNPPFAFNGEIDEVRLLKLLGPFRPEMLLLVPQGDTHLGGKGGAMK